jgi:hypothetical protein
LRQTPELGQTKWKSLRKLFAAKLQANVATESLDGSDVFGVADMEMLDANLVVTPRGNPLNNFSQNVLDVCTSQSL